jgi:signal transduction histidine kinase
LQQQLATLQADHKEVLHLVKEQEEQVARLGRELQDGRKQAAAAEDLVKGLQLENVRYGCDRETSQDGVSAWYGCEREKLHRVE